jgi:hypothetical protein
MKNLKELGKALNKAEQKLINGGLGNRCVPMPNNNWCSIQARQKGRLIDSKGNFIGCCHLPQAADTVGPCSHPC